ncbi:Photosystem I chlorophyll a apoprotein [Cesiribacter andamanensis AMV16]|uniref:Photosystem I chlorophyll a apoprotein n=2 Tax=Cesiribacter TaxID=1133570 RepID=M7NAR1_9BACT|nr:Photosystem I chlorophyll a apoprotein [Cesiribacter andamanensis AMV16]
MMLLLLVAACNPYKKGVRSYQLGEYQVAINQLEKVADKNPKANFFLAESYRLSNRIDQAEPYYAAALQAGLQDEEARFYYGYALKANSKYTQARQQFESYLGSAPRNEEFKQRARKEVNNLQALSQILSQEPVFVIKHLTNVNTADAEYGAVAREGELYFTSSRGDAKIYKATGKSFTNLYRAQVGQAMETVPNTVEKLPEAFNMADRAEGAITFSPDGNTMVFARGNAKGKKGGDEVNLYISYFRNGLWSEPVIMRISDPRAWDSTPAFSRNGKTLYFASNRRGGLGGVDLYSAQVDARGNWGRVQNMGKEINTPGNEMFPYVSEDNRLYFSSDGHPGLGGLDLFIATRRDGKVSIENLGEPMNSPADDFGLSYFAMDKGYFSSNRDGGAGDDDIYAFVNNSPDLKIVNYFLAGTTYTTDEQNKQVILPNVQVRLLDHEERQRDVVISDEQGRFEFQLEEGIPQFQIIGDKPDYFTTRHDIDMSGRYLDRKTLKQFRTDTTFRQDLVLGQIVLDRAIVLDNIYYDFDKADIRADAALELDKLVTVLRDNPQLVIELSSHTDSRGDLAYNIDLSQRRAESAVRYIISKGIDSKRITARGYGKTRPIIANAETEEEHQVNRRTEFKVTDITPEVQVVPTEEEQETPPAVDPEQPQPKKEEKPKKKSRDAVFDELGDGR